MEAAGSSERVVVLVGGHIVTEEGEFDGDVIVRGERIERVTKEQRQQQESYPPDATLLDVRGKLVLPGGVDPHVHLAYPQGAARVVSCDDWRTGSAAALCGGTTTLIDFAEADGARQSLAEAVAQRRAEGEGQGCLCDFALHCALTRADERTLGEDLDAVVAAGVPSFKIYTAYAIRLGDAQMLRAFAAVKRVGGLPIVHCENNDLIEQRVDALRAAGARSSEAHPLTRPVQGEAEATTRVALLAEAVGVPAGVHVVHVTAELALPVFRDHRRRANGMGPVTGEVCAHHLALDESVYARPDGPDFQCAPPMRPRSDVDAMWRALADRTLLFIVTDHCPFTKRQRRGDRRTPEFRKRWICPPAVSDPLAPAAQVVDAMPEDIAAERWIKESGPAGAQDPPFWMMPGGVAGLEARVLLAYEHGVVQRGLPLRDFVRCVSSEAARRYNLWPRKGSLQAGADADILVLDPHRETILSESTLHHNCDHCPFEGMRIHAAVDMVLARGDIVVANGQLVASQLNHRGRFLARPAYH